VSRFPKQLFVAAVATGLAALAAPASADRLRMPQGMGGVPDIGAIPCSLLNEMITVAPLGTRHSLLTWAAGYLNAATGLTLQQAADQAPGGAWNYDRLAAALGDYCTGNPEQATRDAVLNLASQLGAVAGSKDQQ
jgi:hypothetical protein